MFGEVKLGETDYTFYWACDYLSMLGFKLNHVSKWGPGNYDKQNKTKLGAHFMQ